MSTKVASNTKPGAALELFQMCSLSKQSKKEAGKMKFGVIYHHFLKLILVAVKIKLIFFRVEEIFGHDEVLDASLRTFEVL